MWREMENHFACPEQKDVTVVPKSEIFIMWNKAHKL